MDVTVVAGHGEHGSGDHVGAIHALNHVVDLVAIDVGLGARTRLEMDLNVLELVSRT